MEERLHVDATVLISVKFKESGGAEEVTELQGQLRSDSKEGVVVEPFLVIMRRRDILFKKLVELFKIYIYRDLPYLSRTSEVLCLRKRFLAYCLTLALRGFSAC